MKKIFTFLVFLFSVFTSFSQQDPQFSQNMFNHMFINPGYAGANDAICASLLARQQWVGFKGAAQGSTDPVNVYPKTYLFNFDAPVRVLHGGIGLSIMQDQLGFEKTLGLKIAYAYRHVIGNGTLGVGLQGYFVNKSIDFSKFIYIDANDPLITGTGVKSGMATTAAFGLWYSIPSKMYVGFSANQLMKSKIPYPTPLGSPTLATHFYLEGGYFYQLGNPLLELDPSFLIKSDMASTQFDINCLLKYDNKVWGGLSYRYTDAIAVLLGYQKVMPYGTARIGYSYDITTSALGAKKRSSGSHEIFISYCFKVVKTFTPASYSNDRFLWSR